MKLSEELQKYQDILNERHPMEWPEEEMGKGRKAYGVAKENVHGLARYPEFAPAVNAIVRSTVKEIKTHAAKITSQMPYKEQFLLEEIIKELKDLV